MNSTYADIDICDSCGNWIDPVLGYHVFQGFILCRHCMLEQMETQSLLLRCEEE